MTQNIYDDPEFLAGYSQLDRSVRGLDGALEWPVIRAMLPPLHGLRVLDLGCGSGWFCRWAVENGAQSVVGLDISERMLARAIADTDSDAIEYRRQDLEELDTTELGHFDLVYSSLTLHYLADPSSVFSAVRMVLPAGGRFVFSIEHPIFSAPTVQAFRDGENGTRFWPLDNYLIEGQRSTNWFVNGVLKHHRTIATYLNALSAAGFTLSQIVEFGPSDAQLANDPRWIDEQHRPQFLLVAAVRM